MNEPFKTQLQQVITLDTAVSRGSGASLVVIAGEDLGRRYAIEGEQLSIGRAASNQICVDQGAVSRVHAIVVKDAAGLRLRDNQSTNGTFVNDVKVREVELKDGDLIKVGMSVFKVLAGDNVEAAYHEKLYELSTIDGLTQLYNKRHFHESLEREIVSARRFGRAISLMVFDIDHFKRCNDTFGHLAGDQVLRELGARLRERVHKTDLAARSGGEEFSVILIGMDIEAAAKFAELIRAIVAAAHFAFEGKDIPVTISVGVAEMGPQITHADQLIQEADSRLYQAKHNGRNRVVSRS